MNNIRHNEREHRFETDVEGELAVLEYQLKPGHIALTHTEVPKAARGKGIATNLAEVAFNYARSTGLKVVPLCPYIVTYLRRHKELAPLVAPRREQ